MAASTANVINMGPCTVTFNSVDIGHTEGGVQITIAEKTGEAKVDAAGDAPVAAFDLGASVEAKFKCAEMLNASLDAMSNSNAIITGTATGSGLTKVAWGKPVGTQLSGVLCTFIPIDSAKATKAFHIYKAYIASHNKVLDMTAEKAATYEVVIRGLYDDSRTSGDRLCAWGSPTAQVGTAA